MLSPERRGREGRDENTLRAEERREQEREPSRRDERRDERVKGRRNVVLEGKKENETAVERLNRKRRGRKGRRKRRGNHSEHSSLSFFLFLRHFPLLSYFPFRLLPRLATLIPFI